MMRTIYIDSDYICHGAAGEGLRPVETDAFDGMPELALRCYRFVPAGELYEDAVCASDFIQCLDQPVADAAQSGYEEAMAAQPDVEALLAENEDMRTALEILEVQP